MIYIFGDTHVPIDVSKLNTKNFPEQNKMTKDDFVIIAGDFGLVWKNDNEYKWWKNWFDSKNFTTLFVDGNHENFEWLYEFPTINKFSGKVGKISDSIYHLKRGEIYTIDEKRIFIFGGAESVDKYNRVEHLTWWKEEMPNYSEMNYGLTNLESVNYDIDFIITHTCPASLVEQLITEKKITTLEMYLQEILELLDKNNIDYKWYFGHFHQDKKIGRYTCCYKKKYFLK